MTKHAFNWLNLVWFQVTWFIALFFQQQAILILLGSLLMHFYLSAQRRADCYRLVWVTLIGSSVDALLSLYGLFLFPENSLIPFWLILLWAHFALSLQYSMAWLASKPLWAKSLAGAMFAPLSYFAGVKFSAVALPYGDLLSLFLIAVIWSALMPVYLVSIRFMEKIYEGNKTAN